MKDVIDLIKREVNIRVGYWQKRGFETNHIGVDNWEDAMWDFCYDYQLVIKGETVTEDKIKPEVEEFIREAFFVGEKK